MGGINCQTPPSLMGIIPKELMAEYINQLAEYSNFLFKGISLFFTANANIEQEIINKGSKTVNLLPALSDMSNAALSLLSARTSLGSVQSLWVEITESNVTRKPNFLKQLIGLSETAQQIDNARICLSALHSAQDLQAKIWSQPTITKAMATVAKSITELTSWQIVFAEQQKSVELLATVV
ncbi:MAG TPA: hypothetical protein VMQ52_03460 [Candidatus Saccharimonadales bacterium]|jgi:hypothetical protein|nr:hypothetical protein [Candidatus Saccharimonadales bacterium]